MGLRDLFRGSKSTTPTPQPSPGARPDAPAAQPAGRESAPAQGAPAQPEAARPAAGQDAARRRNEPAPAALPESGALRNLVDLLHSRGADRARLTLVQSGNIMTHQTRQAVGEAQDEVENGTVDQGSPLFDDVADLYTQAMSTPVGPWRQLDISAAAPRDGRREITVTYDFPNGESRVEHYEQRAGGAPASAATAHTGQEHDAAADTEVSAAPEAAGTDTTAAGDGAVPAQDEDAVRVVDGGVSQSAEDGDVVATGGHPAPVVAETGPAGAEADAAADGTAMSETEHAGGLDAQDGTDVVEPASETGLADEDPFADQDAPAGADEVAAAPADHEEHPQDGVALDGQDIPEAATAAPAAEDTAGSDELPAHVDESAFGNEAGDPLVPAAEGAVDPDEDPSGAPQLAAATDVAPSYRGGEQQPELDVDALAPGNLTLSTGDVVSRLADAQRHLFGSEGSAREVSTVLIRVRALGTYYDALTHVRLNGFWDQRPTFDLVPEDLLKVQELKDDSYVEGSGAPLAMMFRFRPGLPPEVTFDYSDEEAFVRYEQRLPGQNYLEELRMYPRTGSNIPQHVNEALQDWNY